MTKPELRKHIKELKRLQDKQLLAQQSVRIMNVLENHPRFIAANKVMLYSSLPDEVDTTAFVEKWRNTKQIILPTVVVDDIVPVELKSDTEYVIGDFNIREPKSCKYDGDYDLIVVPGVAFDKKCNRLGRGKGYYDRFLCHYLDTYKIGICYDFQLVDDIPTESNDIIMNEIISGN